MYRYSGSKNEKRDNKTSVSMLSTKDIDAIRSHIKDKDNSEQMTQYQNRQELLYKSQERVKHWPNTLEALRIAKENQKYVDFEREELKRRELDSLEQEYQNEVKKKALQKANQQIFENQDRVRLIKSSMLLSADQVDREQQIILQREKRRYEIEQEKLYVDKVLRKNKHEEYQEKEVAREVRQKGIQYGKDLQVQKRSTQQEYLEEYKQNMIEGEEIQKDVYKYREEQKEFQKQLNENKQQFRQNLKRKGFILDMQVQKKKQENDQNKRELLNEKSDYLFNEGKENFHNFIIMKKKQNLHDYSQLQDKAIKNLSHTLNNIKPYESNVEQYVRERFEKELKAENDKKDKFNRLSRQQQAYLDVQVQEKIDNTTKQTRELELINKYITQKNLDLKKADEETVMARKKQLRDYKLQIQESIEERAQNREAKILKEMEESEQQRQEFQKQDRNFYDWADGMVHNVTECNLDSKPLLRQIQKLQN